MSREAKCPNCRGTSGYAGRMTETWEMGGAWDQQPEAGSHVIGSAKYTKMKCLDCNAEFTLKRLFKLGLCAYHPESEDVINPGETKTLGNREVTNESEYPLYSHQHHGRGDEDGPFDGDCVCRGSDKETDCSLAGCGFCKDQRPVHPGEVRENAEREAGR